MRLRWARSTRTTRRSGPTTRWRRYSSKGPTRYDLVHEAGSGRRRAATSCRRRRRTRTCRRPIRQRHVSGTGANAVHAAVGDEHGGGVRERRGGAGAGRAARSLPPRDTKAALQLTSTFLPSAGLVGAGAGMINALAAVELAATSEIPDSTTIAGEEDVSQPASSPHQCRRKRLWRSLAQSDGHRSDRATRRTGTVGGQHRSFGVALRRRHHRLGRQPSVWGAAPMGAPSSGATTRYHRLGRRPSSGVTPLSGASASTSTIVWGVVNGSTIVWGASVHGTPSSGARRTAARSSGVPASLVARSSGGRAPAPSSGAISDDTIVWGHRKRSMSRRKRRRKSNNILFSTF